MTDNKIENDNLKHAAEQIQTGFWGTAWGADDPVPHIAAFVDAFLRARGLKPDAATRSAMIDAVTVAMSYQCSEDVIRELDIRHMEKDGGDDYEDWTAEEIEKTYRPDPTPREDNAFPLLRGVENIPYDAPMVADRAADALDPDWLNRLSEHQG